MLASNTWNSSTGLGGLTSLAIRDEARQACTMSFEREQMKKEAALLASKGIVIGTSSWKYERRFGQFR